MLEFLFNMFEWLTTDPFGSGVLLGAVIGSVGVIFGLVVSGFGLILNSILEKQAVR